MELSDFVQHVAEQFDDMDPAEFTAETEFKELDEWSSLTALSIIAMADEEYNVILKGEDIHNATTVSDLFETVKSKI